MCTRFYILPETEKLRILADKAAATALAQRFMREGSPMKISGEIRPTDVVPVLAPNRKGEISVFPMRWGFTIPGRTLIVNARSESAREKPTFREAWERRRCVIPASWYYEWEHFTGANGQKKVGDKFMFQPKGETITWLCGLYRMEEDEPVFTVLTREASEEILRVHDRMPVILPEEKIRVWMNPQSRPESLLPFALTDMIFERIS